jgi:neuropeptide Y receptor
MFFLKFQAAYLQKWIFPDIMCKIVPFASNLSVNVSILTLIAISIDRYYMIVYSFKKKLKIAHCIFILLAIWIVSFLLSITKIFNNAIFNAPLNNNQTNENENKTYKVCYYHSEEISTYETYFLAAVQYIIPLLILTFIYFRIAYYVYFERNSSLIKEKLKSKRKVRFSDFFCQ